MKSRMLSLPPKQSFLLFGPRGTGKTTWLKKAFPDSAYINLLDSETYNTLLSNPQKLMSFVKKNQKKEHIIIDEVQRIPDLLNEVHHLIESEKMLFGITGSSARKLKRRGVNLLAGRALWRELYPFTARELGDDFQLKKALSYGTLPMAVYSDNPHDYLNSYITTYLREEIQQEGLVRNLSSFKRFLEAATFSQAQMLVVSRVAQDCHVERKVVEDYFSILEDLMIGVRIPVFAKRAKRELLQKTKFFFFDVGVYRTLRPKGPLDSPDEMGGPALETLVFNELRALKGYLNLDYEIFHWRTKAKEEVDFVLYGEKIFYALEIKSSSTIRDSEMTGLKTFLKDYPMAQGICIYLGDKKIFKNNIQYLPAHDFFSSPENFIIR